jgi:omega-6 fatty acid desaturase (delta-12 desaturase)
MRTSKELLVATRPFARDQPWRSWWHLGSTLFALVSFILLATLDWPWYARLPFSIGAGLVLVRFFILFHDHQHGAILRKSRVARAIMVLFGLFSLNPSSVWRRSHDHHHRHNSKNFCPNVGSFPLLTVESYQAASWRERLMYRIARNPLTMVFGYLTVFALGMCVVPLLRNPRRHFDAALSLVAHFGFGWFAFANVTDMLLAWTIPFAIGSGIGVYLFFAQHNFPGVRLQTGEKWDYVFSALHSSSYIAMGPVLSWFTGNIGYHHIHHLNSHIPFYRLPEAMRALEELQTPTTTSLAPHDVLACLRLKLWDPDASKLVPWPVS